MAGRMRERRAIVSSDGGMWTPAQLLALVLGVVFLVLGGVALLRGGVGETLFEPTVSVAGFGYTPLLAIIEIIFGLLLLSVGAFPGAADAVVFLGVLELTFGLIIVIEPNAFQASLGAGRSHGWFYVITGGLAALVSLVMPAVYRWRSTSVRTDERPPAADDSAHHTRRLE
ncbi:MAG: hypothetical protein M3N32_06345 [Actinomycetota bacterium]|nr:hypothetical protein [Actinomycetota bacterium]